MALITFDPGKLDLKKLTGNTFAWIFGGALLLGIWVLVAPYLKDVIWDTVSIAIGVGVLIAMGLIVTNKKFQRSLKYLGEFVGAGLLGKVIEMNRWEILKYRIDRKAEDAEKIQANKAELKGQKIGIENKIKTRDKELRKAIESETLLKSALKDDPNNSENLVQLQIVQNKIVNSKKYIDNTVPALNDLNNLIDYTERAYNSSKVIITNAYEDLRTQREIWETVSTAGEAVSSAMNAILGRKEDDQDAEQAYQSLQKELNENLGKIQEGIEATSRVMDSQDLENAASLRSAMTEIQGLDLMKVDYSKTIASSVTNMAVPKQQAAGKFAQYLTK